MFTFCIHTLLKYIRKYEIKLYSNIYYIKYYIHL